MTTKIGIASLLAGFLLALFSGISSFMVESNIWVGLTLSKLVGEKSAESIVLTFDNIKVQNFLDYLVYEMPVYMYFFIAGILLLVLGMFGKNK